MLEPLCQVCFRPKRKPRFQTRSISICQWCITELVNCLDSPSNIFSTAKAHIREKRLLRLNDAKKDLLAQLTPPPPTPARALANTESRATRDVLVAETLGQFLFRGLIDDTARQVDVAARQRELQDQLLSEHRGRVLAYEHAASVPMTRVAGVNASINGIEQFVDEQFAKFLAVRLTRKPTKFSTTRLLRAHNLGLVQTERKFAPRPDGADADAIGRHIRMRDGYVCVLCRRLPRSSELHVHHIIPLSAFGTNDERNLATLCYACHCRQHPEFQVPRMKAGSGGAGATVNE